MGVPRGIRKRHSVAFKAEVALEAAKEIDTINNLALRFKIHPRLVSDWKKTLLEGATGLFQPNSKQNL
jgi:transposase